MTETHKHQGNGMNATARFEAFSDAVIAIIMTLLVLELRVPTIPDHTTVSQFFLILLPLLPKFLSFAMSFIAIGIFWVNHHHFFEHVSKTDNAMLWYNNFWLFWMCFIPFPTAFLGEHPTEMGPIMLYGGTLFFATLGYFLLTNHAVRNGLLDEHHSQEEKGIPPFRRYAGVVLYGLSVPLAFVSVYLSLAIFLAVPVIYFLPRAFKNH